MASMPSTSIDVTQNQGDKQRNPNQQKPKPQSDVIDYFGPATPALVPRFNAKIRTGPFFKLRQCRGKAIDHRIVQGVKNQRKSFVHKNNNSNDEKETIEKTAMYHKDMEVVATYCKEICRQKTCTDDCVMIKQANRVVDGMMKNDKLATVCLDDLMITFGVKSPK